MEGVAKTAFETADAEYRDAATKREEARLAYIEALKEKAKLEWMAKHNIAVDSLCIEEDDTIRVQAKDVAVHWKGVGDFKFRVDDEEHTVYRFIKVPYKHKEKRPREAINEVLEKVRKIDNQCFALKAEFRGINNTVK